MNISPTMLALGAALAYFIARPKAANAAPAPTPSQSPAKPRPPARAKPRPVVAPTPVPASVPWPKAPTTEQRKQQATELAVLNRPATQSTKRNATPAFNVHREDGSAPQNESAAMTTRERNPLDKSYWMPAKKTTKDEQEKARSFLDLGMWEKGGIWYDGPRTFAGRRQYRAAMHGQKKAIEVWVPKPPFV